MARRPQSFEQQLLQVLDCVYETPYADGIWEPALASIADFLGAECVDLTFLDRKILECSRWESARIDTVAAQYYTTNYLTSDVQEVHPRMPLAMAMRQGQVVADADFWSVRERSQKSFFAEYYTPLTHSVECVMGTVRRRDDDGPWVLLATHYGNGEPPQRELRNRVGMLLGHLRRAVEAEAKLARVRAERDTLAHALDRVGEAVALLSRNGKVVNLNHSAEALFRRPSGLELGLDGRLMLPTSHARAELARGLAQCEGLRREITDASLQPPAPIVVRGAGQNPLVLTLQPLPKASLGAFGAVALLFVGDPSAQSQNHRSMLQSTFGLTPAETELALALAAGETLKEFSIRNSIRYETVRSQLRRVFQKTGTDRQSELVRLSGQMKSIADSAVGRNSHPS